MLTVKKVADLAGVTIDSVRYYTKIGLLKPKRNQDNNYKEFSSNDVKRIKFIHRAKQLRFSLREIDRLLSTAALGRSPCPIARDIIKNKITENKKKITELIQLQSQMEKALAKWNQMTNKIPYRNIVCHLIECWETTPEIE